MVVGIDVAFESFGARSFRDMLRGGTGNALAYAGSNHPL